MYDEFDKKSILEMSMGAIMERVDYEMERVIKNILDPNTKATAKRKINITLELVPDAKRQVITALTTAKSTLCPTEPITTSLCITSKAGTGEMVVAELTPQITGQMDMAGGTQQNPKILRLPSAAAAANN